MSATEQPIDAIAAGGLHDVPVERPFPLETVHASLDRTPLGYLSAIERALGLRLVDDAA